MDYISDHQKLSLRAQGACLHAEVSYGTQAWQSRCLPGIASLLTLLAMTPLRLI